MKYDDIKHLVGKRVMVRTRFGYTHVGRLVAENYDICWGIVKLNKVEYTDQKFKDYSAAYRLKNEKTMTLSLAQVTSCEEFKGQKDSSPAQVYGSFLTIDSE